MIFDNIFWEYLFITHKVNNHTQRMKTSSNLCKCLLLALLILVATAEQYRLKTKVKIQNAEGVEQLVVINDTAVAVASKKGVTILSGDNLESKEERKIDSQRMIMSTKGVGMLQNDGSSFRFSRFAQQNYTYPQYGTISELLVTDTYAIAAMATQDFPCLKKINLTTLQLETINYRRVTEWKVYSQKALLADLGNGDVAYAQINYLYILDKETLETKEIIHNRTLNNRIRSVRTYFNPETNESCYLLEKNWNELTVYQLWKDPVTGKYTNQVRFGTPDTSTTDYEFPLSITGKGKALHFKGCEMQHWDNFQNIIEQNTDGKYFMTGRQQIAVSNDETFFVVRNDSGFYQFYNLQKDYDIVFNKTVFVSYNDAKKGEMVSDDQSLFLSMSNPREKYDIAKVDIKEGEYVLVTDQDGVSDNQVDFHLFDAKYNRFVTVAIHNSRYYLQLRAIDDLSLVQEVALNVTGVEFKFVGNLQWDLTFGLAVRVKPYSLTLQNDSKLYLFKIEADKIINLNISEDVSFKTLEACYKYVITYKERFPPVKALHFSNLSLAFTIKPIANSGMTISVNKHILLLSTGSNNGNTDASYDLSKSSQKLGIFYRDNYFYDRVISLIFPNRGFVYESQPYIAGWIMKSKKIYNVTSPTVSKSTMIDNDNCNAATYFIPPMKTQSQCNEIYFIEYLIVKEGIYTKRPQLARTTECSSKIDKFPIAFETDENVQTQLTISADKKYILILINPWNSNNFLLEIRPIASLNKVIFHQTIKIYFYQVQPLSSYHVNFAKDSIVIIQTQDFMTALVIDPLEFADDHQMSSIAHFSLSEQEIVALAGPSIKDSSVFNVVVKKLNSEDYIFSTTLSSVVDKIALSTNGTFLAVYCEDKTLQVWDLASKALYFTKAVKGITSISFKGDDMLMLEQKEGTEVLTLKDLDSPSTIVEYSSQESLITLLNIFSDQKVLKASVWKKDIVAITESSTVYIWSKEKESKLRQEVEVQNIFLD